MINRNAYHNAMRCGTLLSTPRPDAQHRATPLVASQRNSTICLFYYTAARRAAAPLDSTQLSDFFVINASLLFAPPLDSAQRFVFYQRNSAMRIAPQHCATPRKSSQRFVFYQRAETQRYSTPRNAFQLNDLFVILAPPLNSTIRGEMLLNSTQLNVTNQ